MNAISKKYSQKSLGISGAAGLQSDEDSDDSSDAPEQEGTLTNVSKPKRHTALSIPKTGRYKSYLERSNDNPTRIVPYKACKEDIFSISVPSMNVLESPFRFHTERRPGAGLAGLSLVRASNAAQSAAETPMLMPVPESASTSLDRMRISLRQPDLDAVQGTHSRQNVAAIDSSSDSLAEMQAQLASLTKKLSDCHTSQAKFSLDSTSAQPLLNTNESAVSNHEISLKALRERREKMEADTAKKMQQIAEEKKLHQERLAEIRKANGPPTEVAEAIQRGVADWKAGKVKDRGEAVRARVAELFKSKRPMLQTCH